MLYCKNCGAPVGENDRFCISCSSRLSSSTVVTKAGLSRIAAESTEFSADAISEPDLTGCSVMGMRLTEKLFSFMGADHYRAVKDNGEECIPLMVRHITFPGSIDRDCAMLNNFADPAAAGSLCKAFTEAVAREEVSFSVACATAGVPALNYRTEVHYSELYDVYHIFMLMKYAVPLPLFARQQQLTVRDALEFGAVISDMILKLEKSQLRYGPFSDCMVYVSGGQAAEKAPAQDRPAYSRTFYLDCRFARCYEKFLPMSSYMSYFRQYVSPKRGYYEVYSLAMVLYRLLSGFRHPYIRHRGTVSAEEFMQAEKLRVMMTEPVPADCLQNTIGAVIKDAISRSSHEVSLSELNRILVNSINYVQSAELNRKLIFDGTVGK